MRILTIIARILLGIAFVVFGLNGFFQFLPMGAPPPPDSPAGHFFAAVFASGFMKPIFALQLLGGLLVLLGWVPLGLTILAPIIFNILLFHITMAPGLQPMLPGIFVTLLELFLIARYWENFRPLVQRPA